VSVTCVDCGNMVELKDGSLRPHRTVRGINSRSGWCDMGGKPLSANQRARNEGAEQRNPGDMHEPKPYTGELDWVHPTEGLVYEHKLS
jgi:hypothetical protein